MVWTNLFCRPGQFWHLVLHWVRWLENSPIVLHACNNICIGVWSLVGSRGFRSSLICSPKQKRCPTSTFKVSNFIERKTFFSLSAPLCWWVAFLPPNCWPPPPLNVWMTVTSAKSFGPQTSTNTFTAKSPLTDWYSPPPDSLLYFSPRKKLPLRLHSDPVISMGLNGFLKTWIVVEMPLKV